MGTYDFTPITGTQGKKTNCYDKPEGLHWAGKACCAASYLVSKATETKSPRHFVRLCRLSTLEPAIARTGVDNFCQRHDYAFCNVLKILPNLVGPHSSGLCDDPERHRDLPTPLWPVESALREAIRKLFPQYVRTFCVSCGHGSVELPQETRRDANHVGWAVPTTNDGGMVGTAHPT